jgi:hypothetical protein
MYFGENLWQKAIFTHTEKNAALTQQHHKDDRGIASQNRYDDGPV